MASSKKSAKGNKTAHVLNLLTAPAPAPAGEDESAAEYAPEAPANPLVSPILEVAQSDDDALSQQIQQALEEEFPQSEEPVYEDQWDPGQLPEGVLGWDENGQPIWDPSVLPEGVQGWDENGQPIWDPNVLPEGVVGWDENGQPIYAEQIGRASCRERV